MQRHGVYLSCRQAADHLAGFVALLACCHDTIPNRYVLFDFLIRCSFTPKHQADWPDAGLQISQP